MLAQSAQEQYQAAETAFAAQEWEAASKGYEALLPKDKEASLSSSRAIIAGRLAQAQLQLFNYESASFWAGRAIENLEPDNLALIDALIIAGDAARFSNNPEEAIAAYDRALPLATAAGEIAAVRGAKMGTALVTITFDPARSGILFDEEIAAAPSRSAPDTYISSLEDKRARAALNAGDMGTAKLWIDRALDRVGEETLQISYLQSQVRGDGALIYHELDDLKRVQSLIKYSGAGGMKDASWVNNYDGSLPECGVAGVTKDDFAIIQFAIDEDGRVSGALPIHANRTGDLASIFAREVADWKWPVSVIEDISLFWRATLRFQLRCEGRTDQTGLEDPAQSEAVEWLAEKGWIKSGLSTALAPDDLILVDEAPEIARILTQQLPLAEDAYSTDFNEFADRLSAQQAPASAYALLAAQVSSRTGNASRTNSSRRKSKALEQSVAIIKTRFPDDPATYWLMVEHALAFEARKKDGSAREIYEALIALPTDRLATLDPLRQVSLLHAGALQARAGEREAALERVLAAGIAPDACEMFDTRPVRTRTSGINSRTMPRAAIQWNIDGFVSIGYDLSANGRPENIRAIVSYPPFIFDENALKGVSTLRYRSPKIGDEEVSCANENVTIVFRLN